MEKVQDVRLQYWREKGVIVPVISETGTGRSIYYSKANLVELAVMVYFLSAGLSFDLAGETVKTLKDKEPELFKSGDGKRFMLLGAVDKKAAKAGTGLMLSLVEFDREKAIASVMEGKTVIPVWLDVIYQGLAVKLEKQSVK
ncbi:MAG: MerR family transcriptional regulator [Stigonema ocellatum SAG 48.90 = DSM 106950]|nr:MerR family transcriptional regulator [Stigonema ocellatum SAG 48.90 = DSM 106950]